MAGENDLPVAWTYELDPVRGTYVSTGVHRDRLKLSAPYDVDIDPTAIVQLWKRLGGAPCTKRSEQAQQGNAPSAAALAPG